MLSLEKKTPSCAARCHLLCHLLLMLAPLFIQQWGEVAWSITHRFTLTF